MTNTNTTITFRPVRVSKGRKFRGFAYDVGEMPRTTSFNVYGPNGGCAGMRCTESVRLWEPVSKKFVYCNPSYVEDAEAPASETEAAKADYINSSISSAVAWCRSRKPNVPEKDVLTFARNVIKKHHPEFLTFFDSQYNYTEDVAGTVFSTMDWAFNLGYSKAKCARIAVKALTKKGLIGRPCTYEAFSMWLDLRGLHHYVEKYFPVEGIPADFQE